MDPTIDYYNLNAENFIESTQNVDMHHAQDRFLQLLDENASILDFGCGSGRDTRYFLDKGYRVTATDGSAELCRWAIYMMVSGHALLFCICQRMSCFWLFEKCVMRLKVPV